MRRSIMLSAVLAASVAVLGACQPPANNTPTPKPVSTTTPAPTVAPTAAPTGSPTPGKPGTTPEVKKTDEKNVNKDVKPATAETPKAK